MRPELGSASRRDAYALEEADQAFWSVRGIDMSIQDYRWRATAVGWAAVAAKDEKLAQWMRDA